MKNISVKVRLFFPRGSIVEPPRQRSLDKVDALHLECTGLYELYRCWHLPTHIQMYKFIAKKKSWLIKKVRPPNTLQCDGKLNETLMEMSCSSLPPCSSEETQKRERECLVFNEPENWGLSLYLQWWLGLTMNKSDISPHLQRQPCYYSPGRRRWSTAFIGAITQDTGVASFGEACQVAIAPLHYAFTHHTNIMHLSVPCLVKLWIMTRPFLNVVSYIHTQPRWLMKVLWCPALFCFDPCSENLNRELNIFQHAPHFISLWGITSIKITGLQDQLLLGVLSSLLAAVLFHGLGRVSMFQQALESLLRGTGHVSHQQEAFVWLKVKMRVRHLNVWSPLMTSVMSCLEINYLCPEWRQNEGVCNVCGASCRLPHSAVRRHEGGTHLHGQEPRLCTHLQGNTEGWHLLWVSTWIPAHPQHEGLQM